jgi:hypothetical protein
LSTTGAQSAGAVLMVYPTTFGFNDQTATTNSFQHLLDLSADEIRRRVREEFEATVEQLRRRDIEVVVFEDRPVPIKPDAVFPNNWLSTWPDGLIYLYPMATENRRLERSPDLIDQLRAQFVVKDVVDLSFSERTGAYLEGTGAIVFDHLHRLAYASESPRCSADLLRSHTDELGYRPIVFHAFDEDGRPIYHTNVVLGIQTTTAVVCGGCIADPAERAEVLAELGRHRVVIDITLPQMNSFCANVLEVRNAGGQRFLLLSGTALAQFSPAQLELLSADKTLLPVDIPTIEAVGGGGLRCMLAEVFLRSAAG